MAQFLRPNSDISTGIWTTAPLWSKIDEVTANDSDYLERASTGNASFEVTFNIGAEPAAGTRTLRVRALKSFSTTEVSLLYDLKQGGVSVQSGTIASAVSGNVWTTYTVIISSAISNYANLSVMITSTSNANRGVFISWIELELPDAGGGGPTKKIYLIT